MKSLKLLAIVIGFSISIFSMKLFSQTTQEEYNYITKGYKVQIESGLDMKKGYSFQDYGTWGLAESGAKRECEFKGLVRSGQTKPCAILMIYRRTDIPDGAKYYICIPSGDATELWQQTLKIIKEDLNDSDLMQNAIIWALMKFVSETKTK